MHLPKYLLTSLCGTALLACAATTLCAQEPFKVIDHWKIGGTGGWDYLLADPGAHRLYVTHGPRVEVLDTKTGKNGRRDHRSQRHPWRRAQPWTAKLAISATAEPTALSSSTAIAFATLATIPAGTNPDGIAFEPATKTVWAFNGRSNNATVIDTTSEHRCRNHCPAGQA